MEREICRSGEELGDRYAEARHGVAQIQCVPGAVNVRVALST